MPGVWEIVAAVVAIGTRLPVEKVLFRRDYVREVNDFEKRLGTRPTSTPNAKPKTLPQGSGGLTTRSGSDATPTPLPQGSGGLTTRSGLDLERLAWQGDIALGEIWLLEGHLKNNCIGCGGDVECCWKHSDNLSRVANETISMTTDPFWQNLKLLSLEIRGKSHPDDVKAGTYRSEYPALAVKISELRVPLQKKAMERARPQVTITQQKGNPNAKYGPAETAPPEIKQLWTKTIQEVQQEYPITHPTLINEAKRANVSPIEAQLMIAHERWLEKRRGIIERYYQEEREALGPGEKEEEASE